MIAAIIEAGQTPARRRIHVTAMVITLFLLAAARAYGTVASSEVVTDFDFFYTGAKAVLTGNLDRAYDFHWFSAFQRQVIGRSLNGPFSYPPPFALVIAPLGLLGRGPAFFVFMALGLSAYLLTLRQLAGDWLATALSLLLLPIFATVIFGQNGLFTGALAGLACLGLAGRRRWAGVPLGLLVIKPHLAIGLALYVVIARDWRSFWLAGGVAVALSALSALAFGIGAWQGFFTAMAAAGHLLPTGFFPFYRMVSAYAAVRSLGASPDAAAMAQLLSAALAITAIIAAHRRLPPRQAVGIAAIATLLFSPYAFDYDVLIVGAGLALLLPDLARHARPAARSALYALFLFAACYGLAGRILLGGTPRAADQLPPTLAVIGLIGCLAMAWRILAEPAAPRAAGSAPDQ